MNNIRKIAIFMVLFSVLVVYSFGDSFYSMSGGFYRYFEQYPEENYGRDMEGGNFIISLNYYPEAFLIGWYLRTSFGGSYNGFEWKGNEMEPTYSYSVSDIQISAGPSYRFKLGSMVHIPISLGPFFSIYREERDYYYDIDYIDYNSNMGFFSALNLGLHADVSIIINPFKWFTIVNGIYSSFDLLHWERGSMNGRYRSINNGKFEFQNYNAAKIGFYFGLGLHFEQ